MGKNNAVKLADREVLSWSYSGVALNSPGRTGTLEARLTLLVLVRAAL